MTMDKLPIPIAVSDEEAEACDYLVCMPWDPESPFKDNFRGICCKCGITVMYRWHAPRKPKRICLECMVRMKTDDAG
jgi:hypothetical protein